MDVVLSEKAAVWKGRGKPRVEVPIRLLDLLKATYRTGKVGTIPVDEYGELSEEGEELLKLLRIGAVRMGKRLRWQRDDRGVRFELADKAAPRKKAA